jgi:hypothetical protein
MKSLACTASWNSRSIPCSRSPAFAVGLLVGLTGVGGGSLMTPLLVLLFGFKPATAVGTDLLYAAITKAGGSWVHQRHGNIDWAITGRLALGAAYPPPALTLLAAGATRACRDHGCHRAHFRGARHRPAADRRLAVLPPAPAGPGPAPSRQRRLFTSGMSPAPTVLVGAIARSAGHDFLGRRRCPRRDRPDLPLPAISPRAASSAPTSPTPCR